MFRDDFVWGVASSAYQIEGKDPDDGAGRMIWDAFAEEGHTADGKNAAVACDHMHRYRDDYKLMRLLGIKAYRFSVNWSRIMPEGTGRVNEKAIAMYRDMILTMKENGITPYLTMYHWEFPQALQDRGGWLNEESIQWFAEYAKVIAENFTDLCEYIVTLNEPQCFVGLGHLTGVHAPGKKLPLAETFQIAHNAMRAHGQAVIALRKYAKRPIKIGYAPTCSMAYPESNKPEDIEAARKVLFSFYGPLDNWTWNVAWFNDPVFLGKYPESGLEKFKEYLPKITEEDMKLISQPIDFMGQNIYNGYIIRAGADGEPEFVSAPAGAPKTAANWPVTPECLYWGVKFIYDRYKTPLYITENGMSCHDLISADGRVHDPNRITFLDRYLSALQCASDDGADVRGYFLWTFLDNFEWEKGFSERFGIVHVDFATQKRIAKDSAFWYQKVMAENGANLSVNRTPRPILFLDTPGEEKELSGCTVREGVYEGMTLSALYKEKPELFGDTEADSFPKLLSGQPEELSVTEPAALEQGGLFLFVRVTEGDGLIDGQMIGEGDCFALPCGYGAAMLQGCMRLSLWRLSAVQTAE